MSEIFGAVLIRTAVHGDVAVVYEAESAAHMASDRPDAVQFTAEAIEGLSLLLNASPDMLAQVLQVCRWLPGAIVTQVRREMPAAEAA